MPDPSRGTPNLRPRALSEERLQRVRQLARLLDTAVRIPWTPVRFGLDAVIGLVPGLGEAVGTALAGYILFEAARLGASKRLLLRMLYNVALDALLGAVPLAGDLMDVFWKANDRNVQLLERHVRDPDATKSATTAFFAVIVAGLIGLAVASVAAVTWAVRAIVS